MASDTRDRLVRATSRLLRTQGYTATGLNQVMAEADAPKGSMYFHFPGGKEELAAAAVNRFADRATARMARYLEDHDTVAGAVHAILDAYVVHMDRTGYDEGCAVASVALDGAATHAALGQATREALVAWTDMIAAALEAEGRAPEQAHALATLVIACLEGTIVMAKGEQSTEPIATTRDTLQALLAAPAGS
ncbi:MAG TPA: TetR/AcrR family transcriptional regulator [Acidimicrobiales bacterium]|nr:TetR/AcrR family transcriptional regulator [Acidimicrobiales bacterium]